MKSHCCVDEVHNTVSYLLFDWLVQSGPSQEDVSSNVSAFVVVFQAMHLIAGSTYADIQSF